MTKSKSKLIFFMVYFAYTSIYIARVNLSIAGPEMITANVLDTLQLGALGSAFSTIYAIGRLINGGISDRTPPWIMLTTGLAAAGLANIAVSFFPPFAGIFILWSANAYAQSMLWSSVLCVVSKIYDEHTAKKRVSQMVTSVATGNILAIVINTALIDVFGTRFAFLIPGALTLILAGCVCILTKNIKNNTANEKKHISMLSLLKNKEISLMCIPALFHGVMKENISLWMAVYVVDKYAVDITTSAYYILLIPIIGFIGRIAYTAVYRFFREKENSVSILGFILCILSSLLLLVNGVGMITAVICLSIIYAAVSMINTSILSMFPMHYQKTGNIASVSGVMDFATYLGGGIASFIYGIVIKHFGYSPMFFSWVVISLISIVIVFRLNKKNG